MKITTNFALHFQGTRLSEACLTWDIAHGTQEFHLQCCASPKDLHAHSHWQCNYTVQFKTKGSNCQDELFFVHSPLLKESCSVCCPPLTYMLNFSRCMGVASCMLTNNTRQYQHHKPCTQCHVTMLPMRTSSMPHSRSALSC